VTSLATGNELTDLSLADQRDLILINIAVPFSAMSYTPPSRRHLTVQPAVFSSEYVIRDSIDVNVDSILSQPLMIQ